MADTLAPGAVIDALAVAIEAETVGAEHEPSPGTTTGVHELGTWQGIDTGIWEMSAGVMHDTEAAEIFVVLSGEATVEFLEPAAPSIQIKAGSVVELAEGMQTRWTVTTGPLRKIYLTPAS